MKIKTLTDVDLWYGIACKLIKAVGQCSRLEVALVLAGIAVAILWKPIVESMMR